MLLSAPRIGSSPPRFFYVDSNDEIPKIMSAQLEGSLLAACRIRLKEWSPHSSFSFVRVIRTCFLASQCPCGGRSSCEQDTLTRHIFSCFTTLISMSHMTLAQDCCPHRVIHASCVVFVLTSLRLSTLHSSQSLSSSFSFP